MLITPLYIHKIIKILSRINKIIHNISNNNQNNK